MSIRFGRSGGNYSSSEVMQTENDDWRKIEDVAERRRIQNRLAQRNYRRKLRAKLEELEKKAQQSDAGSSPSIFSAARATRAETADSTSSSSPSAPGTITTPSPASFGQQITLSEAVPDSAGPFNFDMPLDSFLEGVDDMLGPFPISTLDNMENTRVTEIGGNRDHTRFTSTTYGADFRSQTSSALGNIASAPFGVPLTTSYRHPGYLIPPSFSPPPDERPVATEPSAKSTSNLRGHIGTPGSLDENFEPIPITRTPSLCHSTPSSSSDSPKDSSQDAGTLTGRSAIVSKEEFLTAIADITLPPGFHEIVSPEPTPRQKSFIQTLTSSSCQSNSVPSDHGFITLQFNNIFNASILNGIILSFDSLNMIDEDAISPFNDKQIIISPNLPKDLEPTPLQLTVPHHPYIDIVPFAGFREKVLRFLDLIDEDDLCHMMYTDWGVWGNRPWDKTSWEVGQKFSEKYWFLMDEDMIRASNFWRSQKGLKPLKIQQPMRGVERGKVVGEV